MCAVRTRIHLAQTKIEHQLALRGVSEQKSKVWSTRALGHWRIWAVTVNIAVREENLARLDSLQRDEDLVFAVLRKADSRHIEQAVTSSDVVQDGIPIQILL